VGVVPSVGDLGGAKEQVYSMLAEHRALRTTCYLPDVTFLSPQLLTGHDA
jgi:hypothetical protein